MRIALVTKHFSESHGGVERFSVNLARELVKGGHEVHVLAHRWDVEPEGVSLHPVRMFSLFSWTKMISFAGNAKAELEQGNYDIVYALTPVLGGDVFRIGGLHRQWLATKYPNSALRLFRSFTSTVNLANLYLEWKIFSEKGYGLFVANSEMGKEHIILRCATAADCIRVIYNGIDPKVFHAGVRDEFREDVRRELGVSPDVPVLLFLAANWKRKGLDTFLRALPEHGGYRALVVGRVRRASYERLAFERGIADKVTFIGPTPEPARYYAAADLFILPTRYDPFANVCLEALACGLPVITSRENGAAELIRPGVNGHLLDRSHDSVQLRKLIVDYLRRRDRNAMRTAAAETGLAHSAERTAAETIQLFEEALELKRSGRLASATAGIPASLLAELNSRGTPGGWQEVRHSDFAWVLRGKLPDGRFVFYKEFLPRNWLEKWKNVFRGSRARRAQRGSALMRARGFSAPQSLLVGSLPGARSYLLCEAAPGEPLEGYYRESFSDRLTDTEAVRKRQFIRELGRVVATMHRRGIIHGDLRQNNVLVEEARGGWRFHFIDNERTRLSWKEADRNWNLIQIATVALPGLTLTDRMRFFSAYRAERPELSARWKETALRVHLTAVSRLRKKGLVP